MTNSTTTTISFSKTVDKAKKISWLANMIPKWSTQFRPIESYKPRAGANDILKLNGYVQKRTKKEYTIKMKILNKRGYKYIPSDKIAMLGYGFGVSTIIRRIHQKKQQ